MKNLKLKSAIVESGKTQFEISMEAGIYPTRLSQVVNGWTKPNETEKRILSRILKRDESELFLTG